MKKTSSEPRSTVSTSASVTGSDTGYTLPSSCSLPSDYTLLAPCSLPSEGYCNTLLSLPSRTSASSWGWQLSEDGYTWPSCPSECPLPSASSYELLSEHSIDSNCGYPLPEPAPEPASTQINDMAALPTFQMPLCGDESNDDSWETLSTEHIDAAEEAAQSSGESNAGDGGSAGHCHHHGNIVPHSSHSLTIGVPPTVHPICRPPSFDPFCVGLPMSQQLANYIYGLPYQRQTRHGQSLGAYLGGFFNDMSAAEYERRYGIRTLVHPFGENVLLGMLRSILDHILNNRHQYYHLVTPSALNGGSRFCPAHTNLTALV